MKVLRFAALAAALALVVAACGDDEGGITVEGAWARTSPMVATNGAAYMQITATEADALVGAEVSGDVADHAEVHEMIMGDDGMMAMQQTQKIDLPAGEMVSLQPGGYHVMFIDLAAPFEVGQTFDLTLVFESGEEKVVEVEVTEEDPNA